MKMLDMQRAKHAADQVPKLGKDPESVTNGMPGMVIANGLGATLAFLRAKGKGVHEEVYKSLQGWLIDKSETMPWEKREEPDLLKRLMVEDSSVYRAAQAEALEYLSWLKRLAKANQKGEGKSHE